MSRVHSAGHSSGNQELLSIVAINIRIQCSRYYTDGVPRFFFLQNFPLEYWKHNVFKNKFNTLTVLLTVGAQLGFVVKLLLSRPRQIAKYSCLFRADDNTCNSNSNKVHYPASRDLNKPVQIIYRIHFNVAWYFHSETWQILKSIYEEQSRLPNDLCVNLLYIFLVYAVFVHCPKPQETHSLCVFVLKPIKHT